MNLTFAVRRISEALTLYYLDPLLRLIKTKMNTGHRQEKPTIPVPIRGDIPGTEGSGLALILLDALSVPIGLKDGLSADSTTDVLPGARDVPRGEELGEVDVGVVVGTGEAEVLGGEDDGAS